MSPLDRRRFLTLAGVAATALLAPRGRGASRRRSFEVSASLYAWELHDEGVERVLDHLQEMAAVNSVYLIGVMHPEARPFGGATFPHNPVRPTWQAEDARCYWHPALERYGRVKPRLSDHAWLRDTDWLRVLADAGRRRGLKIGVELSHALIDRERMSTEFADLAQRNLRGEVTPQGAVKWLQPPCPNHPDTLAYARALVTDAAADHGVDYVQSCIMNFDPAPPDRGGGCCCDHCRKAATAAGFDLEKIQAALLADAADAGALADWNTVRFASVARFYEALHGALRAVRPTIDLRYNLHSRSFASYGINLPRMRRCLDSVRVLDYTEQEGNPSLLSGKRTWIAEARRQLGAGFPLLPSIGVRLKATPELVRTGVRIAVESGAAGITLGHYDGATFPILRAVREGLVAAGIRVTA